MAAIPDPIPSENALHALPESEFVALWTRIVGEPPAIVIERGAMAQLLSQCAGFDGASVASQPVERAAIHLQPPVLAECTDEIRIAIPVS